MLKKADNRGADYGSLRVVSLKSISNLVDAHRSSVRRWLNNEGMRPIALGQGQSGAI